MKSLLSPQSPQLQRWELNRNDHKSCGNTRWPWLILSSAIGVYTGIVGNWAVSRFQSYQATLWDLGIMGQAIWNTAQGRILHESVNLGFSVSRLQVAHWELIYLPLAVIYRLFPSLPLLLWLQTLILAGGVIPIYLFARRRLQSESAALLVALAYLFYPALHGANMFDIHGLTLATPFLLFTFIYLTEEKFAAAIAFAIISLFCREDVALVIFMLGWYARRGRNQPQIGAVLMTLSTLWLLAFASRSYLWPTQEIPAIAGSAAAAANSGENEIMQILPALLRNPGAILTRLFRFENMVYAAKLLLPVAGFSLFAPSILLIAGLNGLLNLLSPWNFMRQIEYHYSAAIIPFVFFAAIQGMANVINYVRRHRATQWFSAEVGTTIILLSAVVATTQYSILRFHRIWQVTPQHRLLSQALHEIPTNLSVSCTPREGAQLMERQFLYHFPERVSDVDIVVMDLKRPIVEVKAFAGSHRTLRLPALNELSLAVLQDSAWGLRFAIDNTFCLQRGLPAKESFARYAVLDSLPPVLDGRLNMQVGPGLSLVGWSTAYIGCDQAHFRLYWLRQEATSVGSPIKWLLRGNHRRQEFDHHPLFGRLQFEDIPPGKILCDHLFINNPHYSDLRSFSVAVVTGDDLQQVPRELFSFDFPER